MKIAVDFDRFRWVCCEGTIRETWALAVVKGQAFDGAIAWVAEDGAGEWSWHVLDGAHGSCEPTRGVAQRVAVMRLRMEREQAA